MTDLDTVYSNTSESVPSQSNTIYEYSEPILYKPLTIAPEVFAENYNLDITEFVEQHKAKEEAQSKGGSNQLKRPIMYMSYSHAMRLFRQRHPGLEVDCVVNPLTNGYLFKDLDRRGYFMKSYVHDGTCRSAFYYYSLLNMSGQGVHPDDVKTDFKTSKPKLNALGNTISSIDSAMINKTYYRAIVKAIALATGIGLKLWTGDDLSEDILDEKMTLINNVKKLAEKYYGITGEAFPGVDELNYTSSETMIKRIGKSVQQCHCCDPNKAV